MARYQIWDKKTNVITPIGEVMTPEEWIIRYPWINIETAIPVIARGFYNGAFCGELSQMRDNCIAYGAVFAEGLSNEELLAAIEEYEIFLNTPSDEPTAEERIASALEYQNLLAE
jgi:hypothetical protein